MGATGYTGVEVFSATKAKDREMLGSRVTDWLLGLAAQGGAVIDCAVTQSSDREFHCLSIVVFYRHGEQRRKLR